VDVITATETPQGGPAADERARIRALMDLFGPVTLRVAATLRLADYVAAGATELADLAAKADVDTDALRRLMRFLTCRGVFAETAPQTYGLTGTASLLLSDHPSRLRAFLDLDAAAGRIDVAVAGGLLTTVRTGKPGYDSVFGRPFWDDLAADPKLAGTFNQMMAAISHKLGPEIAEHYQWDGVGHVVDVGGGFGVLVHELLTRFPDLEATLVDLPATVAGVSGRAAEPAVAGRLTLAGQSFFDPLPAGGDVYVLSHILHDWNDEDAKRILRNCADAAGPDGRVLIVEMVIADDEHRPVATEYDLRMAVTFSGARERTLEEFTAIGAAAGLELRSSRRTPSFHHVMEWAAKA
jgi:SAM-dependent methyltransferase